MKSKMVLLSLISGLVISTAVLAEHVDANSNNNENDAKVLDALLVLNANEVSAAKEALQKTSQDKIKTFADQMIKDHSQNSQETQAIAKKLNIAPISSKISNKLEKQGKVELSKLKKLPEAQFNKAYINAMVKDHENALNLIDKQLLPHASNPELKQHLQATQAKVTHHLKMAKETKNEVAQ